MPININDLRDAAETLLTASKNKLEKVKKSNNILANAQTEQLQEFVKIFKQSHLPIKDTDTDYSKMKIVKNQKG